MGANRFLKLGGFELDFLSPPSSYPSPPPNFWGLGYLLGGRGYKYLIPPKIGGAWILPGGGLKKFKMF